jgi:hypothetical protein
MRGVIARLALLATSLLLASGCALVAAPPASQPPTIDLDDVLVCEGVERARCEAEATAALFLLQGMGPVDRWQGISSVTISSGGRYEVCWSDGRPCVRGR